MAMQFIYCCPGCGFKVEAWDEGNPYFELSNGKREFFYHPENELEFLGRLLSEAPPEDQLELVGEGNAPDHICLDCKMITKLDPDCDKMECPKCMGTNLADTYDLKGRPCPVCGEIFGDGVPGAIS